MTVHVGCQRFISLVSSISDVGIGSLIPDLQSQWLRCAAAGGIHLATAQAPSRLHGGNEKGSSSTVGEKRLRSQRGLTCSTP